MRCRVLGAASSGVLLALFLPWGTLQAQNTVPPKQLPSSDWVRPGNGSATPPGWPGNVPLAGTGGQVTPAPAQPGLGPVGMTELPFFPNQRLWVNAEYLMWWLNGDPLPPLVTTGPPSTGGILGPGTHILFGDQRV